MMAENKAADNMPATSNNTLAVKMGLTVLALQVIALLALPPLINVYLPELDNEHYIVIMSSLPLLVPCAIFYVRIGGFSEAFKDVKASLSWGLLFGAVTVLVSFAIYMTVRYLADGRPGIPPLSFSHASLFWVCVTVIYFPVLEEVLFRGYILRVLLRNSTPVTAVLVAASLNTMVHIVTYSLSAKLAIILVLSVINCISYIKGGLGASLLTHMINNIVVLMAASGP